jgi:hypothetical protein
MWGPTLWAFLVSGCAVSDAPPVASNLLEVDMIGSEPLPRPLATPAEGDRLAFDQAVATGTSAALIVFLAREPENPWIEEARLLLERRRAPDPPGAALIAGPDAGVVESFDQARLAGTVGAWDGFLARHDGHPLAAEARRLRGF